MKLTNRQLVLGSLQPLLFCIGMYCVILVFSVFVCSSVYDTLKAGKKQTDVGVTTTASVKTAEKQNEHTYTP